jgi:hypothetical protein
MNTRLKEVPYWDMPQFPTSGPAGDFGNGIESESNTEAAFSQIEAALRDVAFQLDGSEHGAENAPSQPTP